MHNPRESAPSDTISGSEAVIIYVSLGTLAAACLGIVTLFGG